MVNACWSFWIIQYCGVGSYGSTTCISVLTISSLVLYCYCTIVLVLVLYGMNCCQCTLGSYQGKYESLYVRSCFKTFSQSIHATLSITSSSTSSSPFCRHLVHSYHHLQSTLSHCRYSQCVRWGYVSPTYLPSPSTHSGNIYVCCCWGYVAVVT